MKMRNLLSVLMLGFSLSAQASDIPYSEAYFCTLHFTKIAYGKSVKSVMAHTGLDTCREEFDPVLNKAVFKNYWDRIKNIDLRETADGTHFEGKVILTGTSTAYNRCGLKPSLQYWISFDDGSSKIESVIPMSVEKKFNIDNDNIENVPEYIDNAITDLLKTDPIDQVVCYDVFSYGNGALTFAEKFSTFMNE